MSIEQPNRWVIVKVDNKTDNIHYRIFATWVGGYLTSDSWKLNSGIIRMEPDDEGSLHFFGETGSCYICRETSYGVAGAYNAGTLESLLETEGVSLMPEDTDWELIEWK